MGFPENVLARGERVVRKLNPHWLTVFVPSLVGILVVVAVVLTLVLAPDSSTGTIFKWAAVILGVLLLVVFVVVPYLRWRTTHYVITSHRVMVRRGIIAKSGKDIALSKITDVSFNQTVWDRIIRAGTLHIESAGDSPDEDFRNIPRANEVQQLINRLVEEDMQRRGGGYQNGPRHGEPIPDGGDPQDLDLSRQPTRPMTPGEDWTPTP